MPRHAAWHCITQQAALCCFISSVAAVFCDLGATRALESLQSTVNRRAPTCLHRRVYGEVNDDIWRREALVDRCTTLRPAAQLPPQLDIITGGLVHGRHTAQRPAPVDRLSHGTGLCTLFVLARRYSAR